MHADKTDQMSIRRKTCETMTLLYEAALKTNPEVEEPKDRPMPINPTAGVSPRPNVGKIVWIKDESRPAGGIWVAATENDRKEGGVPAKDCLLEHELEPGSDLARKWEIAKGQGVGEAIHPRANLVPSQMPPAPLANLPEQQTMSQASLPGGMVPTMPLQPPVDQGMFMDVQSAPNVNPQMNFDGMFPPHMTVTAPGSEMTVS